MAVAAGRSKRRWPFRVEPDACLINRYLPGAKLTLHSDNDNDNDKADLSGPIVSVSLGLPATFLWGGLHRCDPVQRVPLRHGDMVVWGRPERMSHHGVNPLKDGVHEFLGGVLERLLK